MVPAAFSKQHMVPPFRIVTISISERRRKKMLMSYSDCTRKSLKQNVGFKSEGINSDNNSKTLPILYDL